MFECMVLPQKPIMITLNGLNIISTRDIMGKNVMLPKVKTESGRKSFMFQGAKLFNLLPTTLFKRGIIYHKV